MMLLSIQIPTVAGRSIVPLLEEIDRQTTALGTPPKSGFLAGSIDLGGWRSDLVELMWYRDNKEISIGAKRDELYRHATGLYSWQIDDDDWIAPDAISKILAAIQQNPDCVTFQEKVIIDGVEQRSDFSLQYSDWANNTNGFDYVRTPFFKTPIKTALCQQVGVKDMRFGEDHDFAQRIHYLLQSEVHIPEQLYWYQHVSSDFNQRYGITQ